MKRFLTASLLVLGFTLFVGGEAQAGCCGSSVSVYRPTVSVWRPAVVARPVVVHRPVFSSCCTPVTTYYVAPRVYYWPTSYYWPTTGCCGW